MTLSQKQLLLALSGLFMMSACGDGKKENENPSTGPKTQFSSSKANEAVTGSWRAHIECGRTKLPPEIKSMMMSFSGDYVRTKKSLESGCHYEMVSEVALEGENLVLLFDSTLVSEKLCEANEVRTGRSERLRLVLSDAQSLQVMNRETGSCIQFIRVE